MSASSPFNQRSLALRIVFVQSTPFVRRSPSSTVLILLQRETSNYSYISWDTKANGYKWTQMESTLDKKMTMQRADSDKELEDTVSLQKLIYEFPPAAGCTTRCTKQRHVASCRSQSGADRAAAESLVPAAPPISAEARGPDCPPSEDDCSFAAVRAKCRQLARHCCPVPEGQALPLSEQGGNSKPVLEISVLTIIQGKHMRVWDLPKVATLTTLGPACIIHWNKKANKRSIVKQYLHTIG